MKYNNGLEREHILCECSSPEHQMIFMWDNDDLDEIYLEVHLTQQSFWTRLKKSLKYIFGYRCRYGHWDSVVLGKEHIPQFENILKALKSIK